MNRTSALPEECMTSQTALVALERTVSRRGLNRPLKNSNVPANLFGQSHRRASLLVSRRDLQERISVDGTIQPLLLRVGEQSVIRVLARHVQYSPITGEIVHVDLYEVS